jgi:hypothetical protein
VWRRGADNGGGGAITATLEVGYRAVSASVAQVLLHPADRAASAWRCIALLASGRRRWSVATTYVPRLYLRSRTTLPRRATPGRPLGCPATIPSGVIRDLFPKIGRGVVVSSTTGCVGEVESSPVPSTESFQRLAKLIDVLD